MSNSFLADFFRKIIAVLCVVCKDLKEYNSYKNNAWRKIQGLFCLGLLAGHKRFQQQFKCSKW